MKSMLKSLMSVAAAALAFTSCSNDATEDVMPNGGSKTLVVNASIDQTRTVMADDHVKLNWATGDQIHLYIGASATEAHSINPETGGKITGVTYDANDKVYAYYSLTEKDKPSTGAKNVLINIVKEQTQTEASIFAGQNLPMVASSSIENGIVNLVFQPVGCVLVFNVYGQGKTGEKVKSIKFETSKGCYGYAFCDLTAANLGYEAYSGGKNATVTLTNPATIGASKPSDTKVGENQVYLVVAPDEYPAGSKFTVTTDASANNTYTFTTTTPLDCKTKTARVVNLNLAKSPEGKPSIVVPTTSIENSSSAQKDLSITGIEFKNITETELAAANVSAYSDPELTQKVDWLTISDNSIAELSQNKRLYYSLTANTETTPRTAYIGIKCGDAQASIAVTQLAKGKFVATYVPSEKGYGNADGVAEATLNGNEVTIKFDKGSNSNNNSPKYYDTSNSVHCYAKNTITVQSTSSNILKIEIVRGTEGTKGTLSANPGILSAEENNTYIWTGESDKVVLTVGDSGQYRIKSMKIYYGEDNEPKINVPTTVEKQSAEGGQLTIQDIVFKNFAADQVANATARVYSNVELTEQKNVDWLTIDVNATNLSNGTVVCNVSENTTTAERTAYIGIECGSVKSPAIAVTQRAQGAVDKYFVKVTSNLEDWTGDYLIVSEGENKAFNGALKTGFNDSNSIGVTITEGRILLDDDTNKLVVKILQKEGATGEYMYMLQTASGYYLYSKDNATTMHGTDVYDTAAEFPHSININSNSSVTIKSSAEKNRYWQLNGSNFRYYTSNYKSIQLYKLQK